MINPKIKETLENYGIASSYIHYKEGVNIISIGSFFYIDMGFGRKNDNNLKGMFEFYWGGFSFKGNIDFTTDEPTVEDLSSEPISTQEFVKESETFSLMHGINILKLLGIKQVKLEFLR